MSLKAAILDDIKTAMKSGDKARLGVLRMVSAAIKQIEVDERRELSEADVLAVVDKMVKQRRESIRQFRDGGRDDLADRELAEIAVIDRYLPEALDDAELDALIDTAIAETGAQSKRDMGRVMNLLRERAQGRADMATVSARVKARLD
ncbi:MAG: GatB/YqeY domain-containing protein [Pseudomonadota bacterium]